LHDRDDSPAASVVTAAVECLERRLHPTIRRACYNGFWFSPEREALQALVTETQRDVTGLVRLKLYKGNIIVTGRKSPKSPYDLKIATMEGGASASARATLPDSSV
jgi:argininosuccinate synthase